MARDQGQPAVHQQQPVAAVPLLETCWPSPAGPHRTILRLRVKCSVDELFQTAWCSPNLAVRTLGSCSRALALCVSTSC